MTRLYSIILSMTLLGLAGPVAAHPHDADTLTELREKSRELADKARESGEAFIDSDMITNMSELLSDLADRVDVEKGQGAGTALWIDGDEVVRFNPGGPVDDALKITGLGQNLSVERETVIKNGTTRTRIIIEMDGGENVDIDLPGEPSEPTEALDQE